MDDSNAPWFNVFRIGKSRCMRCTRFDRADFHWLGIVFELVSAFGGIGLTLGIPTENFGFSGAFGPVSKIVVIIIMVRGRHRGLPVAIDRASKSRCCLWDVAANVQASPVLLPEDLKPNKPSGQTEQGVELTQPEPIDPSEKKIQQV